MWHHAIPKCTYSLALLYIHEAAMSEITLNRDSVDTTSLVLDGPLSKQWEEPSAKKSTYFVIVIAFEVQPDINSSHWITALEVSDVSGELAILDFIYAISNEGLCIKWLPLVMLPVVHAEHNLG